MKTNDSLFRTLELLCNLFPETSIRLHVNSDGVLLNAPLAYYRNIGGSNIIFSNHYYRHDNTDVFTSGDIGNILKTLREKSIGDDNADKVIFTIQIWLTMNGKFTKVCEKELEQIEVDTINNVIILSDGSKIN